MEEKTGKLLPQYFVSFVNFGTRCLYGDVRTCYPQANWVLFETNGATPGSVEEFISDQIIRLPQTTTTPPPPPFTELEGVKCQMIYQDTFLKVALAVISCFIK